jgi:chromosome segregation ATPase
MAAEKDLIEQERSALETQAVDLGKRLATTEKQMSLLKQQLNESEKRAGELLEKATIADGKIADLERRLSERAKNRQQLTDTLAEIGRLVDTARNLGE